MRRMVVAAVVAAWFIGVAAAFGAVWRAPHVAGVERTAPATWPDDSVVRPANGVANVVLFAHPQLDCSRARLAELGRLADELGADAQVHVVIVQPEDAVGRGGQSRVMERATAIRGAQVFVDHGGIEARRFGAVTSGSTVMYGADGALRFQHVHPVLGCALEVAKAP